MLPRELLVEAIERAESVGADKVPHGGNSVLVLVNTENPRERISYTLEEIRAELASIDKPGLLN